MDRARPGITIAILIFAASIALGQSGEEAPTTEQPNEFDPYSVVGICPIEFGGRIWNVVWHTKLPGLDPVVAERIHSRLVEFPDFGACLGTLIYQDPPTLALVEAAARAIHASSDPNHDEEAGAKLLEAREAAQRVWTSWGVDEAIREVAETGEPGEHEKKFLAFCYEKWKGDPVWGKKEP